MGVIWLLFVAISCSTKNEADITEMQDALACVSRKVVCTGSSCIKIVGGITSIAGVNPGYRERVRYNGSLMGVVVPLLDLASALTLQGS